MNIIKSTSDYGGVLWRCTEKEQRMSRVYLKMSAQLSRLVSASPRIAPSSVRRCSVLMQHLKGPQQPMSTSPPEKEDEVLFSYEGDKEKGGAYRLITLNRPKALNSLNLNMIQLITPDMLRVAEDDSVHFIVMKGAGGKAYCAGGDIRAITDAGKVGDPLPTHFFQGEYRLNHLVGTCKKPFVAIIDGITMGGGVGLSVHGPFRVTTERTLFAMPETFIGLYPDVGGSHFLPRLRGSLGMFLALTGHRLKGRDVLSAGVATHLVATDKLPELYQKLAAVCSTRLTPGDQQASHIAIRDVLNACHKQCAEVDARNFSLEPFMEQINRCFSHDSVEGILAALEEDGSDWAQQQLKTLSKMSPTSLKVTHHQLRLGAQLSFDDCFKMEYRMSLAFMKGKDFYEGVRAVLIDKDNSPKWSPSSLDQVTPEMVQSYFQTLPSHEELTLLN